MGYSWNLLPDPPALPPAATTPVVETTLTRVEVTFLGRGVMRPFLRDRKNDFANSQGAELVRACVGQILGTHAGSEFTQGELPWRTEFGSLLYLLRHQKNSLALKELARTYVVDALRRWEPRVRVKNVACTREEQNGLNVLAIRLRYDIINANSPGNEVVVADVDQTVQV